MQLQQVAQLQVLGPLLHQNVDVDVDVVDVDELARIDPIAEQKRQQQAEFCVVKAALAVQPNPMLVEETTQEQSHTPAIKCQ